MTEQSQISRGLVGIARTAALFLALSIPIGYFAVSYRYLVGTLETEAEINSRLVSGLISANPEMWRFEQVRLDELLAHRPREGTPETRRIFDAKNAMAAESVNHLHAPLIKRSCELRDAGIVVGRMEISRSLWPLLWRTLLAMILGVGAGLLVFRVLPFRALIMAEQKLREAHEFLGKVMESSTNAIIVLDPAGNILFTNRRCGEMTGHPHQALTGKSFVGLFSGDAKRSLLAAMQQVFSERASIAKCEVQLQCADNHLITLDCGVAPLEGQSTSIVVSAEDISERKRAEERLQSYSAELEENNKELKSFAYIVSHDLRAPLVNIKGFASELNGSINDLRVVFEKFAAQLDDQDKYAVTTAFDEDLPEALDFINSSVARMDGLINAILKLSRLGHRDLKQQHLDMGEMVQSLLKTLTHQLEKCNGVVVVGELPEVEADRIAMEQVMGNLLDNAVKYLDPARPGMLEIHGERGTGETIFHVTDNGRGIEQDDQGKIFEIFRRAGRQDVQGEGMGLAFVKTLVRRLGGRIWCNSQSGEGSTFSFTIPHESPFDNTSINRGET